MARRLRHVWPAPRVPAPMPRIEELRSEAAAAFPEAKAASDTAARTAFEASIVGPEPRAPDPSRVRTRSACVCVCALHPPPPTPQHGVDVNDVLLTVAIYHPRRVTKLQVSGGDASSGCSTRV